MVSGESGIHLDHDAFSFAFANGIECPIVPRPLEGEVAGSPEVVVARGAWSAGRRRVLKTAAGLRSKPSGRHFTMCSVLVGQRQFPIRFPRDGATPDPSAGPAERGASRPRRERCMGRGHPPSSTR